MSQQSILMTPGPVPLHPKVREILSGPAEHHRTPQFVQEFAQALSLLPKIFQTTAKPLVLTSTGTGAMEALMVNTLSPGDQVMCVVGGKFGERFLKMATAYGLNPYGLEVPWGDAAQISEIDEAIKKRPDTKALFIQATETSTATAHPIEEIGSLLRNKYPDVLFFVDAITALAAYPIKMDAWGIDGLIGGSQKAFMLPTGLSFIALSEKAWLAYSTSKLPKYYFDLGQERKANESQQSAYSTPTHMLKALSFVLSEMLDKGLDKHFAEIRRRFEFTHFLLQKMKLALFSSSPSISVTAFKVPEPMDGKKWRLELERNHGLILMGGQDRLEGQILRVGHMGYITDEDLMAFAQLVSQSLSEAQQLSESEQRQIVESAKKWLQEHP